MMRTVFDSQLALLDAQMLVMASSMEEAVMGAVEVLESRDKERARAIMEGDDDIDHQEREIEALCLKLLLTQQPVAGDLRRVSAALKMVGDMERIADQAADVAEIVLTLEGDDFDPKLHKHLAKMGRYAAGMVHDAAEAFVKRDGERAAQVVGEDAHVNEMFDRVKRDIIKGIQSESDPAANLVEALMVAKYLERVGDHAQNIAEWVEYSITGRYKGELLG